MENKIEEKKMKWIKANHEKYKLKEIDIQKQWFFSLYLKQVYLVTSEIIQSIIKEKVKLVQL